MSSNKRVKIFLKKNDSLLNFMWADVVRSDSSVMMGIYGSVAFKSAVEKIFDKEGDLIPGKHFIPVDSDIPTKNTKINFHASGFYKLTNKIKKGSIDRTTIKGAPIKEILKPTRMLEVFLPAKIGISTTEYREGKDAIIDITKFPNKPLRCTVTCMPIDKVNEFNQFVDTSIIESSYIFEYENMAWVWTLRISKNDVYVAENNFYIFVPGEMVWPRNDS